MRGAANCAPIWRKSFVHIVTRAPYACATLSLDQSTSALVSSTGAGFGASVVIDTAANAAAPIRTRREFSTFMRHLLGCLIPWRLTSVAPLGLASGTILLSC